MTIETVFRVDGSSVIGSGHVMRCLSLAERLRVCGVQCHFICRAYDGHFGELIAAKGFGLELLPFDGSSPANNWLGVSWEEDVRQTIDLVRDRPPHWMIIDHYAIDEQWQQRFKKASGDSKLLVIDDLADRSHLADLLVDHTPGRIPDSYSGLVPSECEILAGLDYANLREEFREARSHLPEQGRQIGSPVKILVTFGASDKVTPFLQNSCEALGELAQSSAIEVTVIGGNRDIWRSCSYPVRHLERSDLIAELIAQSDFLICGGGVTTMERVCLGVPAIVLKIAENQNDNLAGVEALNLGVVVENAPAAIAKAALDFISDPVGYENMSRTCWESCDGRGTGRIVQRMISSIIELRPCTINDAQFVYDARYADDASRYYRKPCLPVFSDHLSWFENALKSGQHFLYIAELAGEPIGHVRFDPDPQSPDEAEIGIALDQSARGKGIAVPVVAAALAEAENQKFQEIRAEVHQDNIASQKVFAAAGFHLDSERDETWLQYRYCC